MNKKIKNKFSLILDMFPLIMFFLSNKYIHIFLKNNPEKNLIYATSILIITTLISIFIKWLLVHKISLIHIISLIIILIFGGLTVYLNNEYYIKIKPTILNLIFAFILFSGLFFKKNFLYFIIGPIIKLDKKGWFKFNLMWGTFFICLAILNEYVWRNFHKDVWVNFKSFYILPITIIFTIISVFYMKKHILKKNNKN